MHLKDRVSSNVLRAALFELYDIPTVDGSNAVPSDVIATPDATIPAPNAPEHVEVEAEVFQSLNDVLGDFNAMLAQCQGSEYDAIRAASDALAAALTAHCEVCGTDAPVAPVAPQE